MELGKELPLSGSFLTVVCMLLRPKGLRVILELGKELPIALFSLTGVILLGTTGPELPLPDSPETVYCESSLLIGLLLRPARSARRT
jgi:hypothetical protein